MSEEEQGLTITFHRRVRADTGELLNQWFDSPEKTKEEIDAMDRIR